MRVAFMIILGILAVSLGSCAYKASKSHRKYSNTLRKLLLAVLTAVIVTFIIVFSESEQISKVMYSIYAMEMTWIMYFMLYFSLEYVGSSMEKHVKMPVVHFILLLDTASLLLNNVFGHALTTKKKVLAGNHVYFACDYEMYYKVHLFIVNVLMLCIFIVLVHKTLTAPKLYRRKYLVSVIIFLAAIFVDLMHQMEWNPVDITIAGYALGSLCLYYYALSYQPRALVRNSLGLVIDDMVESVFIFDAEGTCLRINDRVHEMFPEGDGLERIEAEFAKWKKGADLRADSGKHWEFSMKRNGTEFHYMARYHSLYDEKNQYLGSFWTVRDRTEIVEELKKEHYRATHDMLTGLYNEEWFYEKVEERLQREPEEAFYMVCSDVRNFRFINDILGKQIGDELLIKMAGRMRERIKVGGIYGHLEYDRFAMLVRKSDFDPTIFKDVPKEVHTDKDLSYPVNIFLGVYEIIDRTMSVHEMCERAIMAVHTLKGGFNLKVAYYDEELRDSVLKEQEFTQDLERAIKDREIQIYLQPQLTAEGRMLGAEALVRWLHPTRGMVMPGEFIEIFEQNGLIVKLDQHVWRLACEHLKRWKEMGWADKYISVNISPTDFHFIDIYKNFIELVEEYDISPQNLRLELTETAVITNLVKQLELIEKLRNAGFIVEMDDFGSGYSSLNMLKDIRVDILKFDLHFLRNSSDIERSRKIIKALMILSKELNMPAISEGVETQEQVDFLKGIGCNLFQGYFFDKPMDVGSFEAKYMR